MLEILEKFENIQADLRMTNDEFQAFLISLDKAATECDDGLKYSNKEVMTFIEKDLALPYAKAG
jgi:hypothetical protein